MKKPKQFRAGQTVWVLMLKRVSGPTWLFSRWVVHEIRLKVRQSGMYLAVQSEDGVLHIRQENWFSGKAAAAAEAKRRNRRELSDLHDEIAKIVQ